MAATDTVASPRYRAALPAVAAVVAILLCGTWCGSARAQQPADAGDHYDRGVALYRQRKPEEAAAEFREAIRLEPDYAAAHYGLRLVLKEQGKRHEAVAAFRTARDNAPPGSEFRLQVERELNATDR